METTAEILSSREGRKFISALEPVDAALCIEILDNVRSYFPSTVLTHKYGSPGYGGA